MRSPLALVVLLSLAPGARAVPGAGPSAPVSQDAPADWRRDAADERVKAALLAKGWRLEDGGAALDPKTKAPVTKAVLEKAVLELVLDAQRAALETVNLLFDPNRKPEPGDAQRLKALATELPPGWPRWRSTRRPTPPRFVRWPIPSSTRSPPTSTASGPWPNARTRRSRSRRCRSDRA
ncbi:MAG: hypothetical protein M0D55_16420 [Elusimicrobiota bacterium]|nr:MAG: hypothetical protein M0D55_16420 [Elusimicrobiota bacterium]